MLNRNKLRKHKFTVAVAAFFIIVITAVFYPWFFLPGFLSYGDWIHNLPLRVAEYKEFFLIWDGALQTGTSLGVGAQNNILFYWIALLYALFQEWFGISVSISTRLFWFIPYIVFAFCGGWYLGYTVAKRRLVALVSSLIYPLSTFGLLTVQGGQMTVAVAFAVAPLVLSFLIRIMRRESAKYTFYLALVLCVQTVYDIRFAYITLLTGLIILIVYWLAQRVRVKIVLKTIGQLAMAMVWYVLLSAYWVVPMFLSDAVVRNNLPSGDDTGWLEVLSYASITNALATNHVWWPWAESATLPIQPLFFIGLILLVSGLFLWRKYKLVLPLLAAWLLGIFLTKGVNAPFGSVYEWLFSNFPGFSFFRDPAKFFTIILLAIAPLAGLGALNIVDRVKKSLRPFVVIIIIVLVLAPISIFVIGDKHGTFVPKQRPVEYEQLEEWYQNTAKSGRTLWLPRQQRFIAGTQDHPAIDVQWIMPGNWHPFFIEPQAKYLLAHPYAEWLLNKSQVRYVGVPWDSEEEIFQHYDLPQVFTSKIDEKGWLTRVDLPTDKITLAETAAISEMVYTASGAVIVDSAVSIKAENLPILHKDQDILYIPKTDIVVPKRTHTQALALEKTKEEIGSWHFATQVDTGGRLILPIQFTGHNILLDGEQISYQLNNKGEPFITSTTLSTGKHTLSLDFNTHGQNILPASNVNEIAWQRCSLDEAPYAQTTFDTSGSDLKVTSSPVFTNGCVTIELGELPTGTYLLRAVADTLNIGNADIILWQAHLPSIVKFLGAEELTENYAEIAIDKRYPVQIQVVSYSSGDEPNVFEQSTVSLQELSLELLYETEPTHVTTFNDDADFTVKTPPSVFSQERLAPYHYQIEVDSSDEPFYLVLSQAYAPAWHLEGDTTGDVTAIEHVQVNGGLNAWLLPAGEKQTINIVYASFVPFYLGIIITLLTGGFIIWRLRLIKSNQKE